MRQWLRYGPNQEYTGYLSYPERAPLPLPAVLVIQEAWGVDQWLESVVHRFALAGYSAFAPDLYARHGERPPSLGRDDLAALQAFVNGLPPGVWQDQAQRESAIAALPDGERAHISAVHQAFLGVLGNDHLAPLTAALHTLRSELPATRGQRIGSVGFCLGGGLSARLAVEDPGLAAAVIYYGTSPVALDAARIKAPMLGFYGERDPRINATIGPFAEAAKAAGVAFEQHVYAGAEHAFFNDGRPSYHVQASRDAWARTLQFFRGALG